METPAEIESSPDTNAEKMFTAERIPEIVQLFKEADVDKSGGLDMDEFYEVMKQINPDVSKEEIRVLHMKIDTNCDRTVDLGELLHYLLQRNEKAVALDFRNLLFPNDFTYISGECLKPIVKMICLPVTDTVTSDFRDYCSVESMRSYIDFAYITITSNGLLKVWLNDFKLLQSVRLYERGMIRPAFHHTPTMLVTDAVYIHDLEMLAVSTSDREVLFYGIEPAYGVTKIQYAILEEEFTAMDYYCAGNKGILACGDARGYLFVFVSYYVSDRGLFCPKKLQISSSRPYPTVTVSSLLIKTSKDFDSLRFYAFDDMCTEVRYIPAIQSFCMCGTRSTSVPLINCIFNEEIRMPIPSKQTFESQGTYCKCVAYSPWSRYFLTGGETGFLYVWLPHKTKSYEHKLRGHNKTVTHIMYNSIEKVFVSISIDQHICIWADGEWTCKQSIFPSGMTSKAPITSVFYNIHNNELFVANSDIAKCFGRGTNVFHHTLRSHNMPLCSMLYHSIYKQVISVCQKGILTVWDTLTGKAVMEFAISGEKVVGPTCISFDDVNRKLITISCDRTVKQWNFNIGELLDVLPVKLPNDVTSIVCTNDMFISIKGSSKILQFDPNGKLKNVLEHFLLDTICSMDYFEDKLITASTNGNILTWDLEASEVEDFINTTISPRIYRLKFYLGQLLVQYDLLNQSKKRQSEEEKVLIVKCLRSREVGSKTATLLIIEDVYITGWSTTLNGGMVGKFKAVKGDDVKITCASVSETETVLLTGDSNGVICLYDIREFGIQTKVDNDKFEIINGWKIPLQSPPLLTSWQASLSELVSVACDPACEKIITAELEYNVKLWTKTGTFVGIFGKDRWMNMVQRQTVPVTEETEEPFCLENIPEHDTEEGAEEIELPLQVKTMPFLIDFMDLFKDKKCLPEKPSSTDIEAELLNKITEKACLIKSIYTWHFEKQHSNFMPGDIDVLIEPKTPVKVASEDEKKAEESTDEVQQIINTLATTESTMTMGTSEKRHSLTYYDKYCTKNINLSKKVGSPKLSDGGKLWPKPYWLVNLCPKGPTEPLTDLTTTKSPVERMPERKTNLVKLPPIEVQPAQTQLKPHPPKTPTSAGPTRQTESKRGSKFVKDSTREALQTQNVILPIPECSKEFKSLRDQLKLVKHEVSKLEGPSRKKHNKSEESSNEAQQGSDFQAKQSSTSIVATEEKLSPSTTTKEPPVLSNEQIPVPCFPGPLLRSPWLEKSPESEGWTPLHDEIRQPELSLPLPPKSKVVKFTEPLVKSQFTKTSTHMTTTVKSVLRNTGSEEQMPVRESTVGRADQKQQKQQLVRPSTSEKSGLRKFQLVTQPKVQTTSQTTSLPPISKNVSIVQTQQKLHLPMTPAGPTTLVGSSGQCRGTRRHTQDRETNQPLPALLKTVQPPHPEHRPHPPMTFADLTRTVGSSRTQRCTRGHTYERETNVRPSLAPLKKVQFLQTEQKPHPPMTPADLTRPVGSSRSHRCIRGHTHERETNTQPSPAHLKKVQFLQTEQKPHPPMTPAGPNRPVGSSRSHRCIRGHTHERETNIQPSPAQLKKVQFLQTEQKPHPPMTPADLTRPVGSSRTHRCARGHTHERETNLQPSPPRLKKVQPTQTEQKPHPPMTPAGPNRPVGSSGSRRCIRGHTHERETNLSPSPAQLKKVQPPQTEQKPHPPMTPAGPTRPVGSSRTHRCARGHTQERETNLSQSPARLKKVQPPQTEQKPHPPMTPAGPTRPVGSSRTHRCARGHTHERETNLQPSPAQIKKVQPPQTEQKPHPPMTPAGPTRPVGSSRTHRCARGHTH